uniref:Uncharacterized protein n=1 Tax=Rhizophora mucronata TaxID=61149 RepID=A0A2P2NCV9_RHIMU
MPRSSEKKIKDGKIQNQEHENR